ncbi:proton-coupled amino acid transporter 2 isoform X1 [Bradysia coprophila]|uniref:proton-coupled amino acid transporter 2 isoform X1 n=1 Tax=Bradysia coprophila TaxID=38358 RepID=UPI00187D6EED|nr:proton-coupled amino acid transporter 2 isoform X1 [Bradysia coprophila]
MAGSVKRRIAEFYRRQQFRFQNPRQTFRIAIRGTKEIKGLSVCFGTLCVVDLFGVFPIIALPAALINCGYYGIPLLFFVITIQVYTAVILGRCWIIAEKLNPTIINKNRYPYAAVAELVYGKCMRNFVTILLDMTVFGGGVPNLLVAAQNLQLLGNRISNGNFYFSFCYWLVLIGLFMCPIMWLGSPKNMKALASVSVFTCSAVALLIWAAIILDGTEYRFKGIELGAPSIENLLQTYGMIIFQFDIHPMLMTIQVDMQQKHKIGSAVCLGIIITSFMAVTTTVVAGYRYGASISSNVLEILPKSNVLYFAIMLVTLQLCLSSAVGTSPLFQHIEEQLKIPKKFSLKRCLVRSLLLGLAVLLGELVPKFDLVMGIIGGTLTGPLMFILPPLLYTKILKMEQSYDNELIKGIIARTSALDDDSEEDYTLRQRRYGTFKAQKIPVPSKCCAKFGTTICKLFYLLYSDYVLSVAVIIFGVLATVASTYFNLFNVRSVSEFWSPCIYNISYSFIP